MITQLRPEHRQHIIELMESTKLFTKAELGCALELVDFSFNNPGQEEYIFDVYEMDGKAVGFICYGPTPLCDNVYDMYWIAVAKERQSAKIGTQLLQHMETKLKEKKVRMIIAETSSQPSYEATRQFYIRRGYVHEGGIKDFYRHGDDLMFFVKRF